MINQVDVDCEAFAMDESRSSLILADDLFTESLPQFSPEVLHEVVTEGLEQDYEPKCSDNLQVLFELELIKSEEDRVEFFGDLYPEVTLNEDLEMKHKANKSREDTSALVQKSTVVDNSMLQTVSSRFPEVLLESLIQQMKNQLTPTEVCRSVSCFVPVIPVHLDGVNPVSNRRPRKRNRTMLEQSTGSEKHGNRFPLSKRLKIMKKRITSAARSRPGRFKVSNRLDPVNPDAETNKRKSCSICSREFRTEKAFQSHHKPVEDTVDTTCQTCSLDLTHPNCLRYHRRKVHGEEDTINVDVKNTSRCSICNKLFTGSAGLGRQSHDLEKSGKRKYTCRKCHKLKTGSERNGVDSNINARKTCRTCEICEKVFTRVTGLLYHRRQVHRIGEGMERKFECNLCEKSFLKKSHLILHGQTHTGERFFPCRFCNRSFGGTTGRRLHEEKVHGENANQLTPEQIEKKRAAAADKSEQASESTGRVHLKGDVPRTYPCTYCTKIFSRPSAKRVHERRHTGEKPFLCVVCGNTYKSSVALKEHEKTAHTRTLDLLCTLCGAAFGRQMSLKYHILSRHSDKKFACEKEGCGRAFVQRAKLVRHQKIHKLGLFQCNVCNRTLESDELLKRHMFVHEMRKMKIAGIEGIVVPRNPGSRKKLPPKQRKERKTPAPVRKLQCTFCEKRFPYQNELDKHVKAVHLNDREFKCSEAGCTRAYISHYKLQNHLRKGHGHVIENNLLAEVTCDECGKTVQGVARLTIHKNSRHSGANSKQLKQPVPILVDTRPTPRRRSRELLEPVLPSHVDNLEPAKSFQISQLSTADVNQPNVILHPPAAHSQSNPVHSIIEQGPQNYHVLAQGSRGTTAYIGSQRQEPFAFFNIPQVYNASAPHGAPIHPPSFPYSSATLAVTVSQQHHQPIDFDFQNGSNFWHAHQPQQLTSRTPQQQVIQHLPIPPANLKVDQVPAREDYTSSDYSDLIRIPAQQENDYQHSDNDNYSTSHENGEEGEPEDALERETIRPVKKRGRPRKNVIGDSTADEKRRQQQRSVSTKPRKPLRKKELPCPVCNKIFGTNQHLRTHQQTHEKKDRESTEECKCEVCGKTFTRPYYLTVHSVIHDPTLKPFKCSEPGCGEAFRAPSEFRKHKTHHSTKKERKYRCKICKEEKPASGELHAHIIEAHPDKMHACQHPGCNFKCPTASRLRRHGEQHEDKGKRLRPYKCPQCECSYIRGENLQQHLDTSHGGASTAVKNPNVSAFICHICSKQFEFEWKVKSHIRKTHKKRQSSSNYVPRSRPLFYYCEDCDWSFANSGALKRHLKSKHSGDPILCFKQPCDKKYFYINKFENHLRTQHDNISAEDEQNLEELRMKYPLAPEGVEDKPKNQRRSYRKKEENILEDDVDDPLSDDDEFYSEDEEFLPQILPTRGRKLAHVVKREYSDSESSEYD